MKKLALIALVLLIIPLAMSVETLTEITYSTGDLIELDTRYIEILNIGTNAITVLLDNYTTKIIYGSEINNGIEISVGNIFWASDSADRSVVLNITVHYKNECTADSDCTDSNACTIDYCTGAPKSCDYAESHINITQCYTGDSCCPSRCSYSLDRDCPLQKCISDSQCNDYNFSTNDTCDTEAGACNYTAITWCYTGDDYCPNNCTFSYQLVANRDLDCNRNNECISHAQCNDSNPETIDLCQGNPKKCNYTINTSYITFVAEGAAFEASQAEWCGNNVCGENESAASCPEDCLAGYVPPEKKSDVLTCAEAGKIDRVQYNALYYCDGAEWHLQKDSDVTCENNYECLSSSCEDSVCKSTQKQQDEKSSKLRWIVFGLLAVGIGLYIFVAQSISKKA